MKIGVVIVAAGRGERAGAVTDGPKQYRKIGRKAVIAHVLDAFLSWRRCGPVVVVIHPDDVQLFRSATAGVSGAQNLRIAFGADTRQRSVNEGLRMLDGEDATHVMIHDAARPFLDHALLDRLAAQLDRGCRAVLPALAVTDTVKRADASGLVEQTIPRSGLYPAQTPQCFHLDDISAAHKRASETTAEFTDDASIAEWAGIPVTLVEGCRDNVKLTVRQDIDMADEKLTRGQLPDVRTGNGYDVHQLVDGDGVTLCGIHIPHDQKLSGHSDADVALHALTDALLATCGAGDIGDHFPPSDMQWHGAASSIFLTHAVNIVRENGGTIMNADISLIAEAPKIAGHRLAMRQNLSSILGIPLDRCSVKATTNETIGFVGRREGIAAIATATVVYEAGKA